ncbi:2-hydroxyacid dehydrogenase [Maribacter arcticus]|uniref:D-3-phosphoglycerate dehydrogenase n=1 Tax=Maribacter arcticus TaxID=561365 RepID=A0A1T5B3K2_9FLAO|nr:2-hydroxyacid dehydrogenase [Maribacter arcticus]SKB41848.1 D-3-phosphoglycerate dehydrogenase [Maribacter arcticus]|tara:strand:- start:270 stop:1214 length:945 start_codon:yes stop_codon:yes gene_type:complete
MKVLHVDINHPLIIEQFSELGFQNVEDYTSTKKEIESKIDQYDGLIIRSRFTIDSQFLDKAKNLKFIGRLGAGLENIDIKHAKSLGIFLAAAPEGNRNAVGEHAMGMLLSLFNKLNTADREVRSGKWDREGNRGLELEGKVVGIIGYGNMGKAFAKKLIGFDVEEVICYDIQGGVEDENARQVGIMEFQNRADVVSLHVPQTAETVGMVHSEFLNKFQKPIWIINTARGKCIITSDLVEAMKSGKVLGAGLDVLEYEKASFENMFSDNNLPDAFQYLINSDQVVLSPHVAGWTVESKIKLAQTIVDKIKAKFIT